MAISEKHIEEEILIWINQQPGCFAFKVNTTGFYDTKRKMFRQNSSRFLINGTSDVIGCVKGKMLALEIKSESGMKKYRHHPGVRELNQIAFLRSVTEVGGIAMCVSSLAEVKTLILMHLNTH